jgi:hypothetical protein
VVTPSSINNNNIKENNMENFDMLLEAFMNAHRDNNTLEEAAGVMQSCILALMEPMVDEGDTEVIPYFTQILHEYMPPNINTP